MIDEQAVFLNDDGSVATWIEEISSIARLRAFLFKAAFGVIPASYIIFEQLKQGTLDDYAMVIAGLLCLIGIYFGAKARAVYLRRCYSYEEAQVSFSERLRESWLLLVAGCVLALLIVLSQTSQEETYLALLLVACPFLVFGMFKLMNSKRLVLTSGAAKARTFFGDSIDAIDVQNKSEHSPFTEKVFDVVDPILDWLGHAFKGAISIILALVFFAGIAWVIYAGASHLPVSVAIIIGAIIIAMAVRR